MDPLLLLSATELARKVRDGEATSREIVEAHIRQVQRVNPVINAVVRDRFEEARREADVADRRVRDGDRDALPPLHGVPCTIKESFALAGMPQTGGLWSRRHFHAGTDAVSVARLRAAGAIPIGITNVSELCMWMESTNRVYGRTNNPYDPRRIVGGSSGGEGAIVGAGASPFGLGGDIGGSIRMPAFFNGVFGHKATGGTVPNSGQFPVAHGKANRLLSTGPIARRAEDLMPLLRILAGPDGEDPECALVELGDPGRVDLSTLRVIDVVENGVLPVSDELRAAQQRVVAVLRAGGARIERATFPLLRRTLDIWSAKMRDAGGPSFADLLGNGREVRPLRELGRWALRRSDHTLVAIMTVLIERLENAAPRRTARGLEAGERLRRELVERIGPHGVMLYPSYPHTAPRHHRPLFPPLQWLYTAILNAMELPATQVPLGLDQRGLPLGVQVAAVHGNDHVTIAVAQALERAFGGWVPPRLSRARLDS